MIVDLPQFLSDLQKHKVDNAKDCQQAKSQNVTKDDKFRLQAEKKTPFKSIISGKDDSWCQPDFKQPSSGPSCQAESEGNVKILEPGAIRQPDILAQKPDSQSTSLSTNSPLQECPTTPAEEKESTTGWAGQCASKVVASSNSQVATLANLFTRELSDNNIQVGTDWRQTLQNRMINCWQLEKFNWTDPKKTNILVYMILYSLFSRNKTGKNANKVVTYWKCWTIHGRGILLWGSCVHKRDLIFCIKTIV